ncbi:MAG: LytR/AlgR family response regulator transcription factor [Faecousia sp.]
MLRIGICDDFLEARFSLRCALERALERRGMEASFSEFSSGERLLHWLENHLGELDLVFLDMEMGQLDGIDTARRLRAADDGLQLVFVTAYAHRVFDGYGVGALGYLMKPPKPEQLEDILARAAAALEKDAEKVFLCQSGEVTYRIPLKTIRYFVSDRRRVTCVTQGRSCTFYGKLDQVEQQVGQGFVRIHQRYLVRAGAVDRFSGSEVSLGDTVLPVSRSCQQTAMLALARASLEE